MPSISSVYRVNCLTCHLFLGDNGKVVPQHQADAYAATFPTHDAAHQGALEAGWTATFKPFGLLCAICRPKPTPRKRQHAV